MISRRTLLARSAALAGTTTLLTTSWAEAAFRVELQEHFEVARFIDSESVELLWGQIRRIVRRGDVFITHTLVEIVDGDFVVLEDFRTLTGHIVLADKTGPRYVLTKTAESAAPAASPTLDAAQALTQQILADTADPNYDTIANVFPPIRTVEGDGYAWIGVPGHAVPVGVDGRTAEFDPATVQPSIAQVRAADGTLSGLAGGYLPIARFVWPEGVAWTELLAFVSFAGTTWYRVTRVENGTLAWSRAFAPAEDDAKRSYADLAALKAGWDERLKPGMQVDIPDERMADMARFGLIRLLIDGVEAEALADWGIAEATPQAPPPQPLQFLLGMPVKDGDVTSAAFSVDLAHNLIETGHAREALLLTYASMAHQHTRGTWTAPRMRHLLSDQASAWDAQSQQIIPRTLKNILVFEGERALRLCRVMPRAWLADGKLLFIDNAPTRWGRVSIAIDSRRKDQHRIAVKIVLPDDGVPVETTLCLRSYDMALMRSVTVNGKRWHDYDATSETVTLPAGMGGTVLLQVRY